MIALPLFPTRDRALFWCPSLVVYPIITLHLYVMLHFYNALQFGLPPFI